MNRDNAWAYFGLVLLVALLLYGCPLQAQAQQFSVTFRPMDLRVSEAFIGSRQYGLWTAEIKQLDPANKPISRKDVLDAGEINAVLIPFIADSELAADLIENRVYLSRPARAGRIFSTTKRIAGPGLAVAGWATDSAGFGWAGLGLLVVDLALEFSRGREPRPEDIVSKLLPKEIRLEYGKSETFTILSAKMRGAKVVKARVFRIETSNTDFPPPVVGSFEGPVDMLKFFREAR